MAAEVDAFECCIVQLPRAEIVEFEEFLVVEGSLYRYFGANVYILFRYMDP